MKLLPIISAIIPIVITLFVFDNAIFSDTSSTSINKTNPIYQNYLSLRNIIFPIEKGSLKKPINTTRNITRNTTNLEIASNWKSSTLLQ